MAAKTGTLLKKARIDAGLTQEQLAKKITGISASDIGRAERGEKELSPTVLKQIAKITGIKSSSLLDTAKKSGSGSRPAAGTTGSRKSVSQTSGKLTAEENYLLELYRNSDDKVKKATLKLLRGERDGIDELLSTILGTAVKILIK